MRNQGYQNYFDDEVLESNPLKLVELLYRGALDSIAAAKRYLRLGDIGARSRAIGKAMAIVTELSLSLNHQEGGELSRNLADLYGYIERLLIRANIEQCEPPLAEAEKLLSTLLQGWIHVTENQPAASPHARESMTANEIRQSVSCAY